MRLIKLNPQPFSESKEVPGLFNCQIEYEVKGAKGQLEYTGPKFSPQFWHQILSFFRWTYKEMQSECQVRIYVNHILGQWGAWAFPQEARTGMTAKELPVQESAEKAKERFASWNSVPSDDWLYFGTVHHHCSASAFQSSTDERNEQNQDGLHITVGKMDGERHDLHSRFYLAGHCFEPDMSCFWPIGQELAEQVPGSMHDQLAKYQMGAKVTVDFPDTWRLNLVEVKPEPRGLLKGRAWEWDGEEVQVPLEMRLDDALEDISRRCSQLNVSEKQWMAQLLEISNGDLNEIIISSCIKYGVMPEDLLAMSQSMLEYAWPGDRE